MASRRLPIILALEIESAGWQANGSVGDTQAYPRDEHCQSSVGSAADPWRTPQDRYRYRTDQRGQVHGQAKRPAIPRLEDVPSQSCRRHRRDGYVRRTDNRLLYGFLIGGHGRRQILRFGVTAHPTAEWIANQITEACGWEQAPRYLIRDRDGAYGEAFWRKMRRSPAAPHSRGTFLPAPFSAGYTTNMSGFDLRQGQACPLQRAAHLQRLH